MPHARFDSRSLYHINLYNLAITQQFSFHFFINLSSNTLHATTLSTFIVKIKNIIQVWCPIQLMFFAELK